MKFMKSLDSSLLLSVIALMGIGIVQVYSASYILATENYSDGLFFFKKQVLFVFIALMVMLMTAVTPFAIIRKSVWILWLLASAALLCTIIPGVGVKVGGAARWLAMPFGLRAEPGELLKVLFSLVFASLLFDGYKKDRPENDRSKKDKPKGLLVFIFKCAVLLAPLAILLYQPDFGTFVMLLIVCGAILFTWGLKWRYILASLLTSLPVFYFLVWMKDYRRARILAVLDPWSDPGQKGFQVIQSMLSFHSGGITGSGLGQSQGKLFFLPEAHTDFTLAILAEEMGFVGFVFVLGLYGFIVFRGFQISLKAEDPFSRTVALGLIFTFGLSVLINSGVAMGLLPPKGLTLPFLSYGGSSLIVFAFLFGLLLNIEADQRIKKETTWRKT